MVGQWRTGTMRGYMYIMILSPVILILSTFCGSKVDVLISCLVIDFLKVTFHLYSASFV